MRKNESGFEMLNTLKFFAMTWMNIEFSLLLMYFVANALDVELTEDT